MLSPGGYYAQLLFTLVLPMHQASAESFKQPYEVSAIICLHCQVNLGTFISRFLSCLLLPKPHSFPTGIYSETLKVETSWGSGSEQRRGSFGGDASHSTVRGWDPSQSGVGLGSCEKQRKSG